MAKCCICEKNPGKISLTGLSGKVCTECQKHIVCIRTGKVDVAKKYFDQFNISSSLVKQFVGAQYMQYADAVERYSEENAEFQKQLEFAKASKQRAENMLISTTSTLDGYKIVKYIDIVYSEAIYKVSLTKALSAMLSDAVDNLRIFSNNELSGTTKLIIEMKDYIKKDLINKAAMLGANAIVGVDMESTVATDGVSKASINGTAVIVEKIE